MTTLDLERLHDFGYQCAKEAKEVNELDDHDCKAGPEHGCPCGEDKPDLQQEENDMDDDSGEIEPEEDPHGLSDID